MNRLNVKALAIALGSAWAFIIFCVGITSILGWGNAFVEMMSSVYIGYKPGILGAFIGIPWGFFDGAVCGLIIAWVYNKVAGKGK
ncbi:MAG: bacteriophage holin [bacterium]